MLPREQMHPFSMDEDPGSGGMARGSCRDMQKGQGTFFRLAHQLTC
jgi:hypothetical protein